MSNLCEYPERRIHLRTHLNAAKEYQKAQNRLEATLTAPKKENAELRVCVAPARWLDCYFWRVEEDNWPDGTNLTLASGKADTEEEADLAAAQAKAALERGEVLV